MAAVFLKLLNLSISASWLVLAVLVLRLISKRSPKWMNVLLWGIVALRLMLPFSIESALSLIPSAETVSPVAVQSAPAPTTSQLAEMLRFKSFKKTAAMVSLLSAAVDHALNFRNVLLRKRFPRGKSRQKRGKGTVEGVLHKFLALYGVITLL